MIVISSPTVDDKDLEHLVTRVFFKSVELLGGISKLAEYRTLTWLPSLARASFVIVLKEHYIKTDEEIASRVGLTKNTVKNILRADPELALRKIKSLEEMLKEEAKELKVHTAGGIAKLAYKEVKEGKEAQTLIQYCSSVAEEITKTLDVPWAYMVLKKSKGITYPITNQEQLQEHLKDVYIKGIPASKVISSIHYPIKNPAELIHEIKQYIANAPSLEK